MSDPAPSPADSPPFAETVDAKARRKLRARARPGASVWAGLGMMGIVGWSVAIPTLLGAALGRWIDRHDVGTSSWTLALLVFGLCIGCWNAWYWISVRQESSGGDDGA